MTIEKWQLCVLAPRDTIRDAISNLVQSSTKIVLVVSDDGSFVGTVSDGDIRRGLLRGLGLDASLDSVVHKSAIVVTPETPREKIKEIMLENKIQQIPVVNRFNVLLGLHQWDELETIPENANLFVVMAGGEGRRLHPHTLTTPKPMLLIRGKPILEHILIRAKSNGFRNFIIVVHYLSQIIEEYFGDGEKWGLNIRYIKEESPLGTAGGLAQLSPFVQGPVLVTNGDVLSELDYSGILQFHLNNRSTATMAVRYHELVHPFGVVHLNGLNIESIEEKPVHRNYINAGIYVISAEAIKSLVPGAYMNMTDFFATLIAGSEVICAYPIHESWIDIGRPEDFKEITGIFKEK